MTIPILFDTKALTQQRARYASTLEAHDFLHREAAQQMLDNLALVTHPFRRILCLGEVPDFFVEALRARAGTAEVVCLTDGSETLLAGSLRGAKRRGNPDTLDSHGATLLGVTNNDGQVQEGSGYPESTFDAVFSLFTLQHINDLPGMLAQIQRILTPDGLLIAVLPGAESLRELRQVLAEAEEAVRGGVSPRVSPFIDVRDAGALLQRARFALPVADSHTITITYPHFFALTEELRRAGAANILAERVKHFTPRTLFAQAAQRYADHYRDATGALIATAELITLTGWKPAPNQQKPLARGSGKTSLAKALVTDTEKTP